ncbi:hypothetical protein C0995_012856 [Termitomyces sp. Mi166|nr:hypothetical protein C0995_012856 [Termitomyces sp. Mi166\
MSGLMMVMTNQLLLSQSGEYEMFGVANGLSYGLFQTGTRKAVALLFLCLVQKFGGMPIQMSSDCGSETSQVFALANALSDLVQWLWPPLIQAELNKLKDCFNNHVMRKDTNKKNPSGVAPNVVIALPEKYGGENCLQEVDTSISPELIEAIQEEEEDVLEFCTLEYSAKAQAAFDSLRIEALTFLNVWSVFLTMLPLM